jgi:TM2 domain-containing membrane protein YozV
MINQDEVFVITEDDILKPGDKSRAKGKGPGPVAVAKAPKDKADPLEETMADRPVASRASRGGRSGPAAASSLSLLMWGLGQLYNGDTRLAILFAMCEALILAFHYMLYMTWDRIRSFVHLFFVSEWEMMLYASSIDLCVIFLMIYNVAQAYRTAEARGGQFHGLRRPFVSGLASLLVPGWGQLLNGQLGKAMFFLFAFLLQVYVLGVYLLSPFYRIVSEIDILDPKQMLLNNSIRVGAAIVNATLLLWLLSTYDAVVVARYSRRARG